MSDDTNDKTKSRDVPKALKNGTKKLKYFEKHSIQPKVGPLQETHQQMPKHDNCADMTIAQT